MKNSRPKPDDTLTDQEVAEIERHMQRVIRTRSLGMSELEDLLAGFLLIDVRPVTMLTLSELTGYSRRALRVAVVDLCHMGMAVRLTEGWVLTPMGRAILTQLFRETDLIALRVLRGYSRCLLERLRGLPTAGVRRPFKGLD